MQTKTEIVFRNQNKFFVIVLWAFLSVRLNYLFIYVDTLISDYLIDITHCNLNLRMSFCPSLPPHQKNPIPSIYYIKEYEPLIKKFG